MKQFIFMVLTIFAFSLVGCGKTQEEKEADKKAECEKDTAKEWIDGQCVDKEEEETAYTITNKTGSTIVVAVGDASVDLSENECVKVEKSQFAKLKVSVGGALFSGKTLCGSTGKACSADNYNIQIEKRRARAPSEHKLVSADKNSNCSKKLVKKK